MGGCHPGPCCWGAWPDAGCTCGRRKQQRRLAGLPCPTVSRSFGDRRAPAPPHLPSRAWPGPPHHPSSAPGSAPLGLELSGSTAPPPTLSAFEWKPVCEADQSECACFSFSKGQGVEPVPTWPAAPGGPTDFTSKEGREVT